MMLHIDISHLPICAEITILGDDIYAEAQVVRATEFFERHPVFRHEEFVAAHTASGRSTATSNNLLAKHVGSGRLVRIRRGLYATVPRGVAAAAAPIDPFLVASHLTADATVALHAALQFHGKSYSVWRRFHYLTRRRARPFEFRGHEYVPVQAPASLRDSADLGGGVATVPHADDEVRVTTLERALIEVLAAPDRAGGWEEVWRSLEMVEFFDLEMVVELARRLASAVTAARVGFFLEEHRGSLMVEEKHLRPLRALAPRQPRYLDGSRQPGRLVSGWNLIVPERVLDRRWEEP